MTDVRIHLFDETELWACFVDITFLFMPLFLRGIEKKEKGK